MIRICNGLPQCGTVVIAKITTVNKETQMHDCILVEYSDMPAKITRADCHNREKAKEFLNIKVGMTIPLVCQETPTPDSLFVSVSFPTLDKDTIKKYKDNYSGVLRIINTLVMMLYTSMDMTSCEEVETRPDEILKNNKHVRKTVQKMINEIIGSFESTDDLIDAFFSNTMKLHQIAKKWQECLVIPDFHKKLIMKFPLPKESVTFRFEYTNYCCNGVQKIKEMILKVGTLVHAFDEKITYKIAIDTAPFYRVFIKDIDTNNLLTYVESFKTYMVSNHFDEVFESFKIDSEELHSNRKLEETE